MSFHAGIWPIRPWRMVVTIACGSPPYSHASSVKLGKPFWPRASEP
ncbi:Uncharacterised protein [Vibrio cholerae]|nr:Uncharacterised protein [Vibrio cholerae]